MLLIEDVHWAEDDLCDLLETLVHQVRGPLLLLTTARPELLDRRPGVGAGARATRRSSCSRRFRRHGTGQLLDELLGVEPPASVRRLIVERAEGNPFFVEELVATLIDTGVLERDERRLVVRRAARRDFDVPDSVQAVLAARIDLLPAAEKSALQAASVIGRVFWTGPVYELVGGAQPDFGLLEERDFVRRRQGSSLAGRARVRDQARPHARGRLREPAEGVARAPPRRLRRLARTHEARDATSTRRCSRTTTREAVRPEDVDLAWPGRGRGGRAAARARRSPGHGGPPTRPSAATRSTTACPCCTGRSSWSRIRGSRRSSGTRSATPTRSSSTGRRSGRRWRRRSSSAARPPSSTPSSRCRRCGARECGFGDPIPRSSTGGSNARSSSPQKALPPTRRRSPLWRCGRRTRTAARALQAIAERLGDAELRSHALAALTDVAWRSGDLDQARAFGRGATRAARRDLRAGRPPLRSDAGYRGQSRPGQAVRGRKPASSQLTEMVEGPDRAPSPARRLTCGFAWRRSPAAGMR